jgi:predicted Zn-dependent peptidase
MSRESAASRASQIARQLMLYGKTITMEELLDRLSNITTERLTDLSGRLFSTMPTVAGIGPIGGLAAYDRIRDTLAAPSPLPRRMAV